MIKFIPLHVSHLRLDYLAGLVSETIDMATLQKEILGDVGAAKLQTLTAAGNTFFALLNKQYASDLTLQIKEKDRQRDVLFSEIKRTSKSGRKSSLPAHADAGTKMVDFLHPFWNIGKEPIISQTTQINILSTRYAADATLKSAAQTLGIASQMQSLFHTNTALLNLYNERLDEMAAKKGPSASSMKSDVVIAFDEFCRAIEVILSALPSDGLQLLFNEINDLRRKYISGLPARLNRAHTSVAPIPQQTYTGNPVTPLPRVFFQTGKETLELVFAQDFNISYRNNTNVGMAKLLIHGKGKYTGTYETTFHIKRS